MMEVIEVPIIIVIGMIILSYLCGSVSSAILICKLTHLPDPLAHGSGNPGATNVLRIGGKLAIASCVIVFDLFKGMLPVLISKYFNLPPLGIGLVAIFACIGHIYPIFFEFRGGKGVATALGVIAPISFDLFELLISTWLMTVLISGYASLGSIVSAIIAPLYIWWFKPQFTVSVAILSGLLLLRHYNNIKRLLHGQETIIWFSFNKRNNK